MGERTVTPSAGRLARLTLPVTEGGSYVVRATARDVRGNAIRSEAYFYATGSGYVAWERADDDRIDLVPDHTTYAPGETAKVMVQSPYESATALVTVEREGIISSRVVTLEGSAPQIEIPLTEAHLPERVRQRRAPQRPLGPAVGDGRRGRAVVQNRLRRAARRPRRAAPAGRGRARRGAVPAGRRGDGRPPAARRRRARRGGRDRVLGGRRGRAQPHRLHAPRPVRDVLRPAPARRDDERDAVEPRPAAQLRAERGGASAAAAATRPTSCAETSARSPTGRPPSAPMRGAAPASPSACPRA